MEEALVLLLSVLLCLVVVGWPRSDRRVRLRITSLNYQPKPKDIMQTNLRSPANQFAQLLLAPVDALGNRVKLDPDAIIAEVISGEGAKASVIPLERDNGDRDFLVNFVPGEAPGEYAFKLRGDAQPGEGVEILEEDFIYTATPNNAVSLGVTVQYLPKTSLPA